MTDGIFKAVTDDGIAFIVDRFELETGVGAAREEWERMNDAGQVVYTVTPEARRETEALLARLWPDVGFDDEGVLEMAQVFLGALDWATQQLQQVVEDMTPAQLWQYAFGEREFVTRPERSDG
jgi:hypothetical protein